ncbi:MAG: glycosyltransferase family 2 protein [Gelidibacter sp.]|nr:glycosyltransferase family 2 protein [Gelidibacter sp.]
MIFSVSVIIPAYNVEPFIETAIVSALIQPEVVEVIVVDDGSTDKTLPIIKALQLSDPRIKIYNHPNNCNKGRSATRNVGIQKANGNYIAFLDADDYYLENRFSNDKKIIEDGNNVDGVYNAVGFHFYRELSPLEEGTFKLNTVSQKIKPKALFDAVISSKYGYLHLNGLTVKKAVFDTIGFFNESLLVAEDSDIIYKMALKCSLESGSIAVPLAKRGIHDSNVFNRDDLYRKYNIKLYESIISWSCKNGISIENIDSTLKWLWVFKFKEKNSLGKDIVYWASLFLNNQILLFTYLSVKYFPIVRLRKELFPFLYRKN